MVLISEVGAVQSTLKKISTKRKKATSYHYPDDIIKVINVVNNSYLQWMLYVFGNERLNKSFELNWTEIKNLKFKLRRGKNRIKET